MNSFSIIGSCTSRDAIEFIEDVVCPIYIARSSLISIFSKPPSSNELSGFSIKDDIHSFHKRCILDDIYKDSSYRLSTIGGDDYLIIDLIEERVPICIFDSGAIVTYSQPSIMFSNLKEMNYKLVKPFTNEYLILFKEAIRKNIDTFSKMNIIIHRALYVDSMQKDNENDMLTKMYNELIKSCKNPIVITPKNRFSNPSHKHNVAAYHYVDDYYLSFLDKLSNSINKTIIIKNKFTMSKENK